MLPVALQLYSVRDSLAEDFFGTLKKVRELGYDGVEFACGLFGNAPEEIRDFLLNIGLVPVSAHVGLPEMRERGDAVFEDYATIGCRYITIPGTPYDEVPGAEHFDVMLEDTAKFGVMAKLHGLQLCYHNHSHEFVRMPDGEYGLDCIFRTVPSPLLETQLDLCWVNAAWEDPVAYLEKYAGHIPTIHMKDFVGKGKVRDEGVYERDGAPFVPHEQDEGEVALRPVGRGVQNVPALVAAAAAGGTKWIIVEQDEPSLGLSRFECAKNSIDYLKDPKVNK